MRKSKSILAILLAAVLMLGIFAGCTVKFTKNTPIDMCAKLSSLLVREDEIDLPKGDSIDKADAALDEELIGTWKSADESLTYTYDADGNVTAEVDGEKSTVPYSCLDIEGKKIIAEEVPMVSYDDDGNEVSEGTALSFTSYLVENDALFLVSVETLDEYTTSFNARLVVLFRADESGSVADAVMRNPIDIESLFGTWEDEGKTITLDADGIKAGDETFRVSFDDQQNLVVEKDDSSTVYDFALVYSKSYTDSEKKTVEKEGFSISLTYTGKDENDKPNLISVLTDWHAEFGAEDWRYAGTFAKTEAAE